MMTELAGVMDPEIGTMWEYSTAVQTGGLFGRKSEELDRKAFDKMLADRGNAGWELAWVLIDQNLHREKDGHVLIFKRQQ